MKSNTVKKLVLKRETLRNLVVKSDPHAIGSVPTKPTTNQN
jgi:hypothetical protein